MTEGVAPRAAAARVVAAVIKDGRSLDDALVEQQARLPERDRGLLAAMSYGVLREHRCLKALIRPLLRRRPNAELTALLLVGVYQLRHMRVPAHAAVHATVAAATLLRLDKARGVVNAVLRRCQREMSALEAQLPQTPAVRWSHPDWLVERLQRDGADIEAVLAANNTPAPMHLRVNRRRLTTPAARKLLANAGIEATPAAATPDSLTLAEPISTDRLPGFADGRISVQDVSAQQAVDWLQPADGQRVLDACAAPGNKTAHILERADVDLLALDVSADRLATLQTNLNRLQLQAVTRTGDAGQPDDWWDGTPFDRILLDAPCSGTGVIRRHPDIKWLRRGSDIKKAARRQRRLLATLWPLLAPGGRLVYATCSILDAEGPRVIERFLADTPKAALQPMGETTDTGWRIAPGEAGGDGFYYAVMDKQIDH